MKFQKAVVVGCDKKYEHTLGWWLEQYRKTNHLPVIFANFGVSQPTLMWARETFSEVVDVQPENNIFCWGLKQRSVLEAGNFARWVMWIDLDCEINGSLEPFFEPLEFDDDFGIAIDVPEFIYPGDDATSKNQLQAGLFVTNPRGEVFLKWLKEIPKHKCDQRAISSLFQNDKNLSQHFKIFGWDMHCPRLALPTQIKRMPKLPRVVHWTGQIGDAVVAYKALLMGIKAASHD